MNHLKPRQRTTDKKWDYTLQNKQVVYPIGYCHKYEPLDNKYFHKDVAEKYNAENVKFMEKYHCSGHSSYEEACRCYKQYLLDHAFKVVAQTDPDVQYKCEICQEWTPIHVEIGFGCCHSFHLCDKHATREVVEKIFHIDESWES